MKNLVIKITLPKKFGGVAVKTVIEHSGEIVSSNMVILPPLLKQRRYTRYL